MAETLYEKNINSTESGVGSQKIKIQGIQNLQQLRDEIAKGGRFVVFTYQISIPLIASFTRFSPAIFIKAGDDIKQAAKPYNLINYLLGWWNIPDAPAVTIRYIRNNLKGVLDMTEDVMVNITEQGLIDKVFEYKLTTNIFDKPDKWDIKSYKKTIVKNLAHDINIQMIVVGDCINEHPDLPHTRTIGILTTGNFQDYAEKCQELLSKEFRKYARFEFHDLNDEDLMSKILIKQGEILIQRRDL